MNEPVKIRDLRPGDMIDLLVTMRLPGIGLLDFERTREVAAKGYDAALPIISEWSSDRPWIGRVRAGR